MALRSLLPKHGSSAPYQKSNINDDGPPPSASVLAPGRSRGNSIKRLSLGLSRTNEDMFPPFLMHEPEQLRSRENSIKPEEYSDRSEQPKSASTPAAMSTQHGEPQQANGVKDSLGDLPLPKPQRFSILGFRHASDPQLSSRFKNEDITTSTAVKDTVRMYFPYSFRNCCVIANKTLFGFSA